MRVSDELQSGNAVLCMPRDLFREGGHAAFPAGSQETQEEKANSRITAMPGLRLLLPPVPSLHHHQSTSSQVVSSSTAHYRPLIPPESMRKDSRADRSTKSPSSALSINAGNTFRAPCREWSFQVVASLRSNPSSLASDVIAAIDFDETGSLFATAGIARKIRVCSYSSLLSDLQPSEASREDTAEGDDVEERQLLGPHGKGRSFQNLQLRGSKRKKSESDDLLIQDHDEFAVRIICTPAKLSSLKWRPLGTNVIGCGDYDGVVTEWDVEQGLCLCERYEHSGQRIWSVDYSSWFPTLCASASGDGTVRLWTLNCERSIGIIRSPGRNSICCAEFSSDGPHRVAVACADSNVYVYDVRRLDSSLLCLKGHERAASYVRFLGSEELVSASIDSSVKLWDISSSNAPGMCQGQQRSRVLPAALNRQLSAAESDVKQEGTDGEACMPIRTFNSHRNVKNFVGLSVWKESGLIACGSEYNEVFVYEKSKNEPLWRMSFEDLSPQQRPRWTEEEMEEELEGGERRVQESKCFVGAVCWRNQGDHHSLLTANSQGSLQLVKVIPVL